MYVTVKFSNLLIFMYKLSDVFLDEVGKNPYRS